ncbi:MAG: hypothetical protein PWQ06_1641 [Anaerophaga sp.]|nr:hypothetical protein [Anaerophaga sp.]
MSKRNLSIFGIILVFAVIIIAVLWNLYRHQSFNAEKTLDSVPANTALVLRINSVNGFINTLRKKADYRSELKAFESLASVYNVISFVDTSALFSSAPVRNLLKAPVYISFQKIGKTNIELSYHFALQNQAHQNEIRSWINNHQTGKRNYTGFTIYQIPLPHSSDETVYATVQNGVLTISTSSLMVEASIRQQQTDHSLRNNREFSSLNKTTSSGATGSLFINFSQIPSFSEPFFASNSRQYADFLGKLSSWGALDIHLKEDGMALNGFLSASGNASSPFISLFDGIEPQRSTLSQVLPSDTRLFLGYNYANDIRFIENLKKYILNSEDSNEFETANQSFNNTTGKHFVDAFFGNIAGEFAMAFTNYNTSNPKEGRFLVFKTKGQAITLPALKQMQEYFGISTTPVSTYNVDNSISFPIYRGFPDKLPRLTLEYLFPDAPLQFFSFYRNYLVFADSPKSLESFLYNNVLKRTLESHPYFSSFTENFAYEENLFFFAEIPHLYSYISQYLNADIFHPTKEQNKILFNFYGAGFQLSHNSGLNYVTAFANYAPHRDKEPRTIWQSRLDSMVSMKPALVENHYTSEKEIMVQDKANNLYLINNMGRILWKRPLDGPILSEIFQIDYYENTKLQYLFNTEEKLYLLDRNGNHVARYPYTLPTKATNGLAVFDYNNNRNYRVFLALNDRKIYLFDKTGARIPGWNIPQTEGIVTQPVQFFRTSGKDFIVFSDQYRNYIMDRRGNHRVIPDKSFIRNEHSPFYLEYPDSEKSALVTTTTDGSLGRIMLPSGRTNIHPETKVDGNNHYFTIIQENNPKYVLVTPEQLKIFNSTLQPIVNKTLEYPVNVIADIYQFSSTDHKIGLVSTENSKIYLYNSDGSLYQGFPLKGTTRFSIGFLKSSAYRFNLITGGENNYLYNYRVE